MKYLKTYQLFEMNKEIRNKLRDIPDYNMPKLEFIKSVGPQMPDDLIEYIYNWNFIKKSPYGQSYYNKPKTWDITEDKTIRVSDHWNFEANMGGVHCKTKEPVENSKYWYVGIYDKESDTYSIINKYPKLDRNKSEFRNQKLKELNNKPELVKENLSLIVSCIGKWMVSNRLYSVDLEPSDIVEVIKNTWWPKKLYMEDGKMWVMADFKLKATGVPGADKLYHADPMSISDFKQETIQKILDYLYSLSDDEIEQMRADQESEKFNI